MVRRIKTLLTNAQAARIGFIVMSTLLSSAAAYVMVKTETIPVTLAPFVVAAGGLGWLIKGRPAPKVGGDE